MDGIIICGIICLLVFCGLGYWAYCNSRKPKHGNIEWWTSVHRVEVAKDRRYLLLHFNTPGIAFPAMCVDAVKWAERGAGSKSVAIWNNGSGWLLQVSGTRDYFDLIPPSK